MDTEKFDVNKDLKNSSKGFFRRKRMLTTKGKDNLDYKARIHEQFEEVFQKKNPKSSSKNIADLILLSIKNRKRAKFKRASSSSRNLIRGKSKEKIYDSLAPLIKIKGKLIDHKPNTSQRRLRRKGINRNFRRMYKYFY